MSEQATEEITLDQLIQLALDARLAEVHVAVPARVTAFDRAAGTVDVTIPVNGMIPDGSGNFVSDPYPALKSIPIQYPRCGKFSITFPLEAGDTGRLVFCERNIGGWLTNGQPQDAGDVGMHTLDGAVFEPGLSPTAPAATSASALLVGSATDAKGRIACKGAALELGEGATKGVILAGDKTSADTTMAAFITATIAAFTTIQGTIGAVVVPTAPTDFGKNGSGSASTKAL